MKNLHIAIVGTLLSLSTFSTAQTPALDAENSSPRTPIDGGAIIMPPKTDTEAVRKPPQNPGPGITVQKAKPDKMLRENIPEEKKSKKASCRGRADLCKQDSAR